jgi:hypothetical protein
MPSSLRLAHQLTLELALRLKMAAKGVTTNRAQTWI